MAEREGSIPGRIENISLRRGIAIACAVGALAWAWGSSNSSSENAPSNPPTATEAPATHTTETASNTQAPGKKASKDPGPVVGDDGHGNKRFLNDTKGIYPCGFDDPFRDLRGNC
jgi:hypothetical protein